MNIGGFILLLVVIFVVLILFSYGEKQEISRNSRYTIYDLDKIEGHRFEYVVADILIANGYKTVNVTKGSGDFGVDITAISPVGIKTAIQCKRFSGKVGVKAVQEVYSGMSYYGCQKGMVITNSHYTKQAIELSKKLGVELIGRDGIINMLNANGKTGKLEVLSLEEKYEDDYCMKNFNRSFVTDKTIRYVEGFFGLYDLSVVCNYFAEYEQFILVFFVPNENETTVEEMFEHKEKLSNELYEYLNRKNVIEVENDCLKICVSKSTISAI